MASIAGATKLQASCDGCGNAKVRCDRLHPCGRCATMGLRCVYGPSRRYGKPPRKRPMLDGSVVNLDTHEESFQIDQPEQETNNFLFSLSNDTQPDVSGQCQVPEVSDPVPSLGEWPGVQDMAATGIDMQMFSMLGNTAVRSPEADVDKSHSCARESYEIFRDLICPTPSLHAPASNCVVVSAPLDEVLRFNRDAIDRLSRLLACPCAKSGHRAMVHASIVSRILIWYQQAAEPPAGILGEGDSPTPAEAPALEPFQTGAGMPPSLVRTTGFSVKQVPISVGTFRVEDNETQAAMRILIVRCELRKAASLIEMFLSTRLNESPNGGVANLYSYLGAWLKGEYLRLLESLNSRINGL